MTNKEFLEIILRQAEEKTDQFKIKSVKYGKDEDGVDVALVIFECSVGDVPAIIYSNGTCFTPYDWQNPGMDIKTFDDVENCTWYNHEYGRNSVMVDGLPKMLF